MPVKKHRVAYDSVKQRKRQRFWAWFAGIGWFYLILKVIVFAIRHWDIVVTVLAGIGLLLIAPLLLLLFAGGGGPERGEDGNFEEQDDLPFVENYNDWGTYLDDLDNDFRDDGGDDSGDDSSGDDY